MLNPVIAELFRSHGVEVTIEDDWIVVNDHDLKVSAEIVGSQPHENAHTIQLDVRVDFGGPRLLVESFAGVGPDMEKAVTDAFHSFVSTVFHVILAAFVNDAGDQVEAEEWDLGGEKRRVVVGLMGVRGESPKPLPKWFTHFQSELQDRPIGEGTHWIRLYYAHSDCKTMQCEALLDNVVCEPFQDILGQFDWPKQEAFYSVRVLVVFPE